VWSPCHSSVEDDTHKKHKRLKLGGGQVYDRSSV
jgi:hypothetical protein